MKLQAVIFDWAGTVVDYGSRAPILALQAAFEAAGVPVTEAEARQAMGLAKHEHVRAILLLPRVATAWAARHGTTPGDADAAAVYADFLPRQLELLEANSHVIAGVPETVSWLRTRGVKIGSTTGYTRQLLDCLLSQARAEGFAPDCAVCPEDVPGGGRPAPWMCYLNAIRLQVAPFSAMVKIGDTPSDIAEGRAAGMWTIGITRTGNEVGMSSAEWDAAPATEKTRRLAAAETRLRAAGADYLAPSVAAARGALEAIGAKIAVGGRPPA